MVNNAGITDNRSTKLPKNRSEIFKLLLTPIFWANSSTSRHDSVIEKVTSRAHCYNIKRQGIVDVARGHGYEPHINTALYNASKAALNRVMLDYAKELKDTPIKINNVCPGFVSTDLNNHAGERSPEEGARIAVRMASLGDDGPTGTFQNEAGTVPW